MLSASLNKTFLLKTSVSLDCDSATVVDKLRPAFAREFLNGLQPFVGVLIFLASVARLRSRVAGILNMLKHKSRAKFYLKIVTESSLVSRTRLNFVSVNQKVREM